MIATTKLQMDFGHNTTACHVCAKQGDTNSRCVTLCLYENGVPWTIPETAVPVIRYQCLPDGSRGVYDTLEDGTPAWSVSGNEISVVLVPQMLAEAGTALMDIALTEGSVLLATYNVHVHIEGSPQEGTALRQTDYFNLTKITAAYDSLQQAVAQASDTIAEVAAAAVGAVPDAVSAWLEAHPEATTSVEDGSISPEKTTFIHYETYQHSSTQVPNFTNQLPISTDAAGNQLGYVEDTYLSLYTDSTGTLAGFDTSGYIPLTGSGDVLRFRALDFSANTYCRLAFYQADKTFIGAISGLSIPGDSTFTGRYAQDDSGYFTTLDLTAKESYYQANQGVTVEFLRITTHSVSKHSVLTVNEEITYTTVPGPVELINLTLDETIAVPQAAENADAIAALTERVAALEKRLGN